MRGAGRHRYVRLGDGRRKGGEPVERTGHPHPLEEGLANQIVHRRLVQEAHLRLCGMNIDVHLLGRHLEE